MVIFFPHLKLGGRRGTLGAKEPFISDSEPRRRRLHTDSDTRRRCLVSDSEPRRQRLGSDSEPRRRRLGSDSVLIISAYIAVLILNPGAGAWVQKSGSFCTECPPSDKDDLPVDWPM